MPRLPRYALPGQQGKLGQPPLRKPFPRDLALQEDKPSIQLVLQVKLGGYV